MSNLQAYHNDPAIKAQYIARVRAHRAADELVQGTGWELGRGCAVGCTLEAYDHALYPVELGLPEWLAHLEDRIFEGLPIDEALAWPERFLAAIRPGADVEPVRHHLAIRRMDRLLAAQEHSLYTKNADVLGALCAVRACHEAELGGTYAESAARRAASSAESAARRAASSAESAARRAASSASSAARVAVWSTAWSAESAAWSAEDAARSTAKSAESAAWSAAWSAARGAASGEAWSEAWSEALRTSFRQEAADLIELLEDA